MAKIHFESWIAWKRTSTGHLTLKVRESHLGPLRNALRRLKAYEEKHGPRMLEIEMKIHYRKRSLDQNALMWSLLDIIATEHNAMVPAGEQLQDSEYFYRLFLQRYAPREKAHTGEELVKTSSGFSTLEMSAFLDRIFDELAEMDIDLTDPEEIGTYWKQHKETMREKKVILRAAEVFTTEEYKEAVKQCEACGAPVWHEDVGSSCAHIAAVGMGGHRQRRYLGAELMHLCDPCHAAYDNGKGRAQFLVDYPHLKHKIEEALGKEISTDGRQSNEPDEADREELDIF